MDRRKDAPHVVMHFMRIHVGQFFSKRLKAGEECPLKEKKDMVQIHVGAERKKKSARRGAI